MTASTPQYIGTCVELKELDLHAYDDTERAIASRTFARYLGSQLWRALEQRLGYRDTDGRLINSGLSLHSDFAVRFGRGLWKGKPAICCHWSHIHHLWLLPSKNDDINPT